MKRNPNTEAPMPVGVNNGCKDVYLLPDIYCYKF